MFWIFVLAVALTVLLLIVSSAGAEEQSAQAAAPDLNVPYIERLPRYPRYDVRYRKVNDEDVEIPYLQTGTENNKRWPDRGERVTYVAHVLNQGDVPAGYSYEWRVDNAVVDHGFAQALYPRGEATVSFHTVWSNQPQKITFSIQPILPNESGFLLGGPVPDAYAANNSLSIGSHDLTISILAERGFCDLFRQTQNLVGTRSFEDWIKAQFAMWNQRLGEAKFPLTPDGILDRARIDKILILENLDGLDGKHMIPGIDPDRQLIDGSWAFRDQDPTNAKGSGGKWQKFIDKHARGIDWGLVHELTHQLGVIDLYRFNLANPQKGVNLPNHGVRVKDLNGQVIPSEAFAPVRKHVFFTNPGRMGGGDRGSYPNNTYFSSHTAAAMNRHAGMRRGYFGEYLFDTPRRNALRIVDKSGRPIGGAQIKLYQSSRKYKWVDDVPEIEGVTDDDGTLLLPERPVDPVTTATGHTLRPNPFGQIDFVGRNGTMLGRVIKDDREGLFVFMLLDLNMAYWAGETESAVYTLQTSLDKEKITDLAGLIRITAEGSTLRLEAREYLVDETIELKKPIVLTGAGADKTDIRLLGSGPLFYVSSGGVSFEGLTLDLRPARGQTAVRASQAIALTSCILLGNGSGGSIGIAADGEGLVANHLDIMGFEKGIALGASARWSFIRHTVLMNNGTGIYSPADTAASDIQYNWFFQNALNHSTPLDRWVIHYAGGYMNPLFVDSEEDNYYLQPASPLVRAGKDGQTIGALGIDENVAPLSIEPLNPTIAVGGTVQFFARGGTEPYEWQLNGRELQQKANEEKLTGSTFLFNGVRSGIDTVSVSDRQGVVVQSLIYVRSADQGLPPNRPPQAVLVFADRPHPIGVPIQFSASRSSDPDGEIRRIIWRFQDGTVLEGTLGGAITRETVPGAGGAVPGWTVVRDDGGEWAIQTGKGLIGSSSVNHKSIIVKDEPILTPSDLNTYTIGWKVNSIPRQPPGYHNALTVFGYKDPRNYKTIGLYIGRKTIELEELREGVHKGLLVVSMPELQSDRTYQLELKVVNNHTLEFYVDEVLKMHAANLSDNSGKVGVVSNGSHTIFEGPFLDENLWNPVHRYKEPAIYWVALEVVDDQGASDIRQEGILIEPDHDTDRTPDLAGYYILDRSGAGHRVVEDPLAPALPTTLQIQSFYRGPGAPVPQWPDLDLARDLELYSPNPRQGLLLMDGFGRLQVIGDPSIQVIGLPRWNWDVARDAAVGVRGAVYLLDAFGAVHTTGRYHGGKWWSPDAAAAGAPAFDRGGGVYLWQSPGALTTWHVRLIGPAKISARIASVEQIYKSRELMSLESNRVLSLLPRAEPTVRQVRMGELNLEADQGVSFDLVTAARCPLLWDFTVDGQRDRRKIYIGSGENHPTQVPFGDMGRALKLAEDSLGNVMGYYILDAAGAVHSFGSVPNFRGGAQFELDAARDFELYQDPLTREVKGYYLLMDAGVVGLVGEVPDLSPFSLTTTFEPLDAYNRYVDFELAYDNENAIRGYYLMDARGRVHAYGQAPVYPDQNAASSRHDPSWDTDWAVKLVPAKESDGLGGFAGR
ncbi:MAG: hypothetical protein HYY14_02170 [Candidatus Omnitrophica bacterium]|nr:hypothetical protein [Candidatus Omnitrophota bacterium]